MVTRKLELRIRNFISEVSEPYELVEKVTTEGVEHVRLGYILRAIELSEARKELILDLLEASWKENVDHGMRRHWGRAAIGTAQYLLLPTLLSEVELPYAADVVFRISRWHHSTNQIWQRFQPTATGIVNLAWQAIEPLCQNQRWSRIQASEF